MVRISKHTQHFEGQRSNFQVQQIMSDKIVVGNLEKLQERKCDCKDTYLQRGMLRGLILTMKQG